MYVHFALRIATYVTLSSRIATLQITRGEFAFALLRDKFSSWRLSSLEKLPSQHARSAPAARQGRRDFVGGRERTRERGISRTFPDASVATAAYLSRPTARHARARRPKTLLNAARRRCREASGAAARRKCVSARFTRGEGYEARSRGQEAAGRTWRRPDRSERRRSREIAKMAPVPPPDSVVRSPRGEARTCSARPSAPRRQWRAVESACTRSATVASLDFGLAARRDVASRRHGRRPRHGDGNIGSLASFTVLSRWTIHLRSRGALLQRGWVGSFVRSLARARALSLSLFHTHPHLAPPVCVRACVRTAYVRTYARTPRGTARRGAKMASGIDAARATLFLRQARRKDRPDDDDAHDAARRRRDDDDGDAAVAGRRRAFRSCRQGSLSRCQATRIRFSSGRAAFTTQVGSRCAMRATADRRNHVPESRSSRFCRNGRPISFRRRRDRAARVPSHAIRECD